MKRRLTQFTLISGLLGSWLLGLGGCSSTEVTPSQPPSFLPPTYIQVPHPAGMDLADLRSIFLSRLAPPMETLKDCDADFRKLRSLTQSEDELRQGARELVRGDPVKYHWCFYGKVLELENELKAEPFVEVRQKKVLDTYQFLTPIARGFMTEFHDSRYYRWSIKHYRQLSQWIFYRKLELSPAATSELVDVTNPFGLWREPARPMPVLEKYNIAKPLQPDAPVAEAPKLKAAQVAGDAPAASPSTQPSAVAPSGTTEVSQIPPPPGAMPEPSGLPAAPSEPAPEMAAAPSPVPGPEAVASPAPPPPAEPLTPENRQPAAQPSVAPQAPPPPATEGVTPPPPAPPSAQEPAPSSSLVPPPAESSSSEAVLNGDEVTPVESK